MNIRYCSKTFWDERQTMEPMDITNNGWSFLFTSWKSKYTSPGYCLDDHILYRCTSSIWCHIWYYSLHLSTIIRYILRYDRRSAGSLMHSLYVTNEIRTLNLPVVTKLYLENQNEAPSILILRATQCFDEISVRKSSPPHLGTIAILQSNMGHHLSVGKESLLWNCLGRSIELSITCDSSISPTFNDISIF